MPLTDFGFDYGSLKIERWGTFPGGQVVIGIRGPKGEIQIQCSKSGMMWIHAGEVFLKLKTKKRGWRIERCPTIEEKEK